MAAGTLCSPDRQSCSSLMYEVRAAAAGGDLRRFVGLVIVR